MLIDNKSYGDPKVNLNPKFVAQVVALAKIIDQLDYYKILRLQPSASVDQIRKAYHQQSRVFHPDRYYHMPDSEFKQAVYLISKRVTDAYVTLRNSKKRGFYDQQLAKSNGKQIRYTEESAKAQKQAKVEETGKTEQGRRLFRQGMQEYKSKNYNAAERTFKMALAYEPENELFRKMAKEAGDNIKTDYRIR